MALVVQGDDKRGIPGVGKDVGARAVLQGVTKWETVQESREIVEKISRWKTQRAGQI